MDPAKYKQITTSRGLTYNYWYSPAQPSKLTLLFCHGNPSTSKHWEKEAVYFAERGYGVVIPDMLGYAGTDKPTDPAAYVPSKLTKDLVEILDAENIKQAVAIGHDWGSKAVSRLANWYPDRFIAYAFLAVAYMIPIPKFDHAAMLDTLKQAFGYEPFGYWTFFADGDHDGLFRKHPDAYVSILFPADPNLWKTRLGPTGSFEKSLKEDFQAPPPSWFTEDDKKYWVDTFMKYGLQAPSQWYKVMLNGMSAEDDAQIPAERALPPISAPIFFGAAKHDAVCRPEVGTGFFGSELFKDHQVTIREFEGDHWIIMSHADEINKALEEWLDTSVVKKASL